MAGLGGKQSIPRDPHFREHAPHRRVVERRQVPQYEDIEGRVITIPVDFLECGHRMPVSKTIHGNALALHEDGATAEDPPETRQCRTCYTLANAVERTEP